MTKPDTVKTNAIYLHTPKDPEWDRWISLAKHDFHHLSAYHRLAQDFGEGDAFLAVYGTEQKFLAWPYLKRAIRGEYSDATSVYGYACPTGRGLDDTVFLKSAWTALKAIWAEQNLVSIFTRLHPVIDNHDAIRRLEGAMPVDGGEVIRLGGSVSIEVDRSVEDRRSQYSQSTRRHIRLAQRHGAVTELDPEWTHFEDFFAIYLATMQRNNASARYLFSREYFLSLQAALPKSLNLVFVRIDGVAVAAMLMSVQGEIAQMHLSGMRLSYQKYHPQKLLIDASCGFAKDLGATRLHLGAGRGGFEDSLFEFKTRFAPATHDFCLGRWVLDKEAYVLLSNEHGAGAEGFFPAYRAPPRPEPGPTNGASRL